MSKSERNSAVKFLILQIKKNERDAILISISNCATSVFAGFVVFAYMGYLSHTTGLAIDKVVQQGLNQCYFFFY